MQASRKKDKHLPNLMKLFLRTLLKQTAAVLLCTLLVLGMQSSNSPSLNAYTDALGRALRHESDFSSFIHSYETIKDKLSNLFSFQEESSL